MKRSILLVFTLAFLTGTASMAQDLDQILKKHFKIIGQEKLAQVNAISIKGKMLMMGMENPFDSYNKRPGKFRVEVDFQGAKIIQGYDGSMAWLVNPMTGSTGAVELSGTQADGLRENADMDGVLWKYSEKGHQAELEGREEMDGTEVFVIKLTKKNGNVDRYYMDAEKYLILRVKSTTQAQGTAMDSEIRFSDFRKIEGITQPFSMTQSAAGQEVTIKFDDVHYDPELDDNMFKKPAS